MLIDVRARLTEFELEALTETEVPFGWSLTPEGIAGGEKFRLMFLTDNESPTSTDIDVYNEFVQAQAAAGHADIQEHSTQFRVLGSTAAVDARDNTETTYTDDELGVPIYWMNGQFVSSTYDDFLNDSWLNEDAPRTADGNAATNASTVWTGSDTSGTESFDSGTSVALGETSVRAGELNHPTLRQLAGSTYDPTSNSFPFYALSGIFVVEPNTPATANVVISGNPRVGETLIATLGGVNDPEGITNIELSYQWTRHDGMNVTDIDGATSDTHVLTDADAEHLINVKIMFKDDYHNLEGPFTTTTTEAVVPMEVLVRNIGQTAESAGEDFDNVSPTKIAQAFTTGANSDGYALTSIGVHFHTIANTQTAASHIAATLHQDSSGLPGAALCTLTDPPSFSASGLHTFTAPTTDRCTVLAASATYWILLVNDSSSQTRVTVTTSSSEDSGGVPEWSIADSHHQFSGPLSTNRWINALDSILIEFRGINAVPNVSATGVPAISGTPHEGSTLTAGTSGISDGNGLPTSFNYQWVHVVGNLQTDIDGATSSTYSLTADDLDRTIFVKVSFIDQDGHPEGPLASPDSGVVTAPDLLVKNTLERLSGISLDANDPALAQAFTTGSNIAGYELHAIGFRLETVDDPTSAGNDLEVTLSEVSSSGDPGAVLCTLADPSTFRANAINRFTPSSSNDCPLLEPQTSYFAVLRRVAVTGSNTIEVQSSFNHDQDEGSAADWAIADTGYFESGNAWAASTLNFGIEITGEEHIEITVPQGWSLTPSGLVGGDKFRLLFITFTGHSSANTDIEDYNDYVKSQARAPNAHSDIKAYNSHFRVLGSTADVDARDNTRTNPNDYASVPIHWMNGAKVADNYGDFYDGSWDSEMSSGRAGMPSSNSYTMWTGSNNAGQEDFDAGTSRALGKSAVRLGQLNGAGDPIDSNRAEPAGTNRHYYALSNIFVVPNSDATGQPAITGTPRVNETLSVDTAGITDPEGTDDARFTYQWIRVDDSDEEDISGATRSTYRPRDEDADKRIKVKVSFIDDQGFPEGPLASEPTITIAARDMFTRNINQQPATTANWSGLDNSNDRLVVSQL